MLHISTCSRRTYGPPTQHSNSANSIIDTIDKQYLIDTPSNYLRKYTYGYYLMYYCYSFFKVSFYIVYLVCDWQGTNHVVSIFFCFDDLHFELAIFHLLWAIGFRPVILTPRLNKTHYDVIKWKHVPRYWPSVRGIHRSPVNSPHKGQSRAALMLPLICAWINAWELEQSWGWWFETPSRSLWCHCNESVVLLPWQFEGDNLQILDK